MTEASYLGSGPGLVRHHHLKRRRPHYLHLMLICLFLSCIPLLSFSCRLVFRLADDSDRSVLVKYGCVTITRIMNNAGSAEESPGKIYHVCQRNSSHISSKHIVALSKTDYRIREVFFDAKSVRSTRLTFNDPEYVHQSIYSGGPDDGEGETGYSHNLYKLWERGIIGSGVVVAVVDDGVDRYHDDLKDNYDPVASYNFVRDTDDPNTVTEVHGTKCIGLISSVANNGICGVGAAFGAKFGAIRILSSEVAEIFDSIEAQAFRFQPNYISIYSMSWGPVDDGKKVARPHALASAALEEGARHGRNGRGSIYVWSSGNGGRNFDFCGLDGYLQRYEVFVVGSTTREGEMPSYAERCTAVIACSLSNSDGLPESKIFTTLPPSQCAKNHTGTSVSAPIVSAILALLLQVRDDLDRRDIQDLLIRTSLQIDKYPIVNSAGLKYSLNFGYGLVQADKLVEAATSNDFKPLPQLRICRTPIFEDGQHIHNGGQIHSSIYSSGCLRQPSVLDTVEVVILTLTLESTSRGGSTVSLISPDGTEVPILEPRLLDTSDEGLDAWDIKVMTYYGEKAYGLWRLKIDVSKGVNAKLVRWGLRVYGSQYSNDATHHYEAVKEIMCDDKVYERDPDIRSWCAGTYKKEVRSSDPSVDNLSFKDSKFVFGQNLMPLNVNYVGIALVSIFGIFSVIIIIYAYFRFGISRPFTSYRLIKN
ncbi:Proprotein convertase subtilisin/kexin type 6 [Thelohanellus kitauei]|uniref:Proprotein convertase subtilisin/kexin type 6 n=1 Tax=Thelohanellus kitauei TaxID=669202 RepID=A0A0C2IBG7_THEKT|nr:Proprotein convertase subtilisin/kexin type 6 [Thelohanellus kitauei]